MSNELLIFGGFTIFILIMLALDLGLFNRKSEAISLKQAIIMSTVWVCFALGFFLLIREYGHLLHDITSYEDIETINKLHFHQLDLIPGDFEASLHKYDHNLGVEFITGYLIEYALSVDNIFIILLIFSAFKVDHKHYHRVLFWGIIGAIAMRFIFIFLGAALLERFFWIAYIFGAFLIYTGIAMLFSKHEKKVDPENHKVVKFASRFFRVHKKQEGDRFFLRIDGKRFITPLFIVLLVIEFTDLVFAVDSIPAIFAVTKDPYIVFFSNIFAILGLRSMFFMLSSVMHKFRYLKGGLAIILFFVGVKMLFEEWLHHAGFTTLHSLFVILGILALSVILSLAIPQAEKPDEPYTAD
jgi:tellurite resistance protein TerC